MNTEPKLDEGTALLPTGPAAPPLNDHWRSPKTLRRMAAVALALLGFAAATFAAGGRLGYAKTYAFPTLDEGKDDDVPAQA